MTLSSMSKKKVCLRPSSLGAHRAFTVNYSKCMKFWPTLNPCNFATLTQLCQRGSLLKDICTEIIFMTDENRFHNETLVINQNYSTCRQIRGHVRKLTDEKPNKATLRNCYNLSLRIHEQFGWKEKDRFVANLVDSGICKRFQAEVIKSKLLHQVITFLCHFF